MKGGPRKMKKRNRSGQFTFILTVILFLIAFVTSSFAEEQKKYPPYPDVWGYEFQTDGTSSSFDVAKMENGDFMIAYTKKREGKEKYKEAWVLFFDGKNEDFKAGEYDKFLRKIVKEKREIKLPPITNVTFSDGSILEVNSMGGSRCADPFDMFLRKKNKDGKVISEKMLLYFFNKPVKKEINQMCERNWQYKGEYYFEKVGNLWVKFVSLEDDTFLMLTSSPESVVIIRFDKDFNTKSDLMNRKIFLIDRKSFNEIRNKLTEKNDQTVNDALSNYLILLSRKEGKK